MDVRLGYKIESKFKSTWERERELGSYFWIDFVQNCVIMKICICFKRGENFDLNVKSCPVNMLGEIFIFVQKKLWDIFCLRCQMRCKI